MRGDNCDVHTIIALSTQQFVVDRYLGFCSSFLGKVGGPEESCFNPLLSLMGLTDLLYRMDPLVDVHGKGDSPVSYGFWQGSTLA